MKSKALALIAAVAAIAVLGSATFVTATNLIEAYGSGPPHYGQTTNMDKWESPVMFLIAVDAAAVLLSGLLGQFAWKRLH